MEENLGIGDKGLGVGVRGKSPSIPPGTKPSTVPPIGHQFT